MSNLKEKIKAAQIDLIKELGIDKLDQEQKEKIVTDIGEIIQQRIVMRVVEELPEEKQDEFQGFLEKARENPEALDEFLKENIPGLENMILEEIGEYKQGALETIKQATGQEESGEPVADEKINQESVKPSNSEEDEVLKEDGELKQEKETGSISEEDIIQEQVDSNQVEQVDDQERVEKNSIDLKTENSEDVKDVREDNFIKEESTEAEDVVGDKSSIAKATEDEAEVSGIEKEQIEDEAKILEENKVNNEKVENEELDLTEELDKMVENDNQEEDKK